MILLVDDDTMSLESLHSFLSSEGYEVRSFSNPIEALRGFSKSRYKVLLTDYMMPETSGLNLIHTIKEIDPKIYTILYTGYSTLGLEQRVKEDDRVDLFLRKPLRIKDLITIINEQNYLATNEEEQCQSF